VLAGLVAARLAHGLSAIEAAADAVYTHGALADAWPNQETLVASRLAQRIR
jgi:NAD(P)H-hydrate repair Nnr-like enzyme with NAD(P)H-hydrate dehydratase domain